MSASLKSAPQVPHSPHFGDCPSPDREAPGIGDCNFAYGGQIRSHPLRRCHLNKGLREGERVCMPGMHLVGECPRQQELLEQRSGIKLLVQPHPCLSPLLFCLHVIPQNVSLEKQMGSASVTATLNAQQPCCTPVHSHVIGDRSGMRLQQSPKSSVTKRPKPEK